MTKLSRRRFAQAAGLSLSAFTFPNIAFSAKPKVVVVGGGAGGASAARHIAKVSKGTINITLIETSKHYHTAFHSNLYLGGYKNYSAISHNYSGLAANHQINVLHEWAASVNTSNKFVKLSSGVPIPYDRLILSPGIDLKYDSIPGYSPEVQSRMPHAWKSGAEVLLLKRQIISMKKGGNFVIVPPPNPYRCPPGPYERVSMVAHLLKEKNPTAKIIILDPKPSFSKQGLFMDGWEQHYSGMIEWIPAEVHGGIKNVDPKTMEVLTDFDSFKADAACIIPAQRAGRIAMAADINDGDWCPINPRNMVSKADPNIYVLGDAARAQPMPKSAVSANSQAKVAAQAILSDLTGRKTSPARYSNTCWSLIATNNGIKVGAYYKPGETKIEVISKFISAEDEPLETRQATYEESIDWYKAITADMFS